MASLELKVELRDTKGRGAARALRRSGWVPAVVYGDEGAKSCRVKTEDLLHLLHGLEGEHALIQLSIAGGKPERALIREVQHHPLRDFIQHVDFQRVSATRKIRVPVPLVLRGEPVGIKEGGVLEHLLRDVMVECLPGDLPEHIEVEIGHLTIGDSIHVRDLPLEKVHVLADPSAVVVVLSRPVVFKDAATLAAEAAAAAGVAAPGAAPAEGAASPEAAQKGGEKGEKAGDKGGEKKEAAPAKKEKGK